MVEKRSQQKHINFHSSKRRLRTQTLPKMRRILLDTKRGAGNLRESGSDECGFYTFLGKPPTKKKFTLPEMREAFLSFFEKSGHTRIKPYPVVARWEKRHLPHRMPA